MSRIDWKILGVDYKPCETRQRLNARLQKDIDRRKATIQLLFFETGFCFVFAEKLQQQCWCYFSKGVREEWVSGTSVKPA